ncbi:MAG: glycoside hydrolase family 172 protein [Mycobacteriales bacterium]
MSILSPLSDLTRVTAGRSRAVNAENPTGDKGGGGRAIEGVGARAARQLGQTWKVAPCATVEAGSTYSMAEIEGPGTITHMWITVDPAWWRRLVLRFYWDGADRPAIEVPLGDFFCNGWCQPANVVSVPVAVNPKGGFNSYWPMPFRRSARITVENLWEEDVEGFFYQVDYELDEVADDAAYLHAQWRRSNPLPDRTDHVILDGVRGRGHFVGTYLAWGSNSSGWWGEGELKFFLDGDKDFPTICGTGTEDYFGGAWGFEEAGGVYSTFTTAYLGFVQALGGESIHASQRRLGMYRWHLQDPVRFAEDLKVTVQALGWRSGGRYLPLRDDLASTAWWYQRGEPAPYPELPDRDGLEVI